MRQAVVALSLEQLAAVHASEGLHDIRDVPTQALEAVMVLADVARSGS
jgi:hypothetical protein